MKVIDLINQLKRQDPHLLVEIEVEDRLYGRTSGQFLEVEEVYYDRPFNRYCLIKVKEAT